jgi:SAM-dependent MidA family methyltransferase
LDLVELGPGRGLFAQDVLDWTAKKFPEFHGALQVTLVEASAGLRLRLEERFADRIAARKVKIVQTVEQAGIEGDFIAFANEFFDALPVEVIADCGELRIGVDGGRFVETFASASAEELEFLDHYSVHPEPGERVEATLVAIEYLRRVAAALPLDARGYGLLIDYGYTRQEQLAGRHRDTVMAYRQHAVSQTPYEAPGEQDITAHVNFTALMEAAKQAGLEPLALVTQSQLLMGIGEEMQFADAFEDCVLPQERAKVALQLKHLATPVGLGDTFQALVLGRGASGAGLSGLKFARDLWLERDA